MRVEDEPRSERLQGWLALALIVTVIAVLYVAVPAALRRGAAGDLRGVPQQTASGVVANLQNTPNDPGGGDDWNSIELTFAGRKMFYALPATSHWSPLPKEPVTVLYRVGHSGVVQIDSVAPADPHPTFGPVR